jgi:hypothetical protein
MDCATDSLVSAAATQIPGKGTIYVSIARMRSGSEQCSGCHDHPRLTVAALDYRLIQPSLL